ncbi:MAG: hypothetical protein AAB874_06365, partial [Patescibacteria group bacterium]
MNKSLRRKFLGGIIGTVFKFLAVNLALGIFFADLFLLFGLPAFIQKAKQELYKVTQKKAYPKPVDDRTEIENQIVVNEIHPLRGDSKSCADSGNKITLGPGIVKISTTLIIGEDCPLTILPATTLEFSPKTSLITYSQVTAIGTPNSPIIFTAANPQIPWGVFAVISAPQKSVFSGVTVENGSFAHINGISATGALSLHDSDAKIDNSVFRFNRGD